MKFFTLRLARITFATALLLITVPFTLPAQNITGEISGRVLDRTGSTIPNATITVTNVDTGAVARTVTTGSGGAYSVPLLAVGRYSLAASATGFGMQTSGAATIGVGDSLTQNFSLTVGTVSGEVTVTASADSPNLENAESSSTIQTSQVNELALNTRNFQQLIQLSPGVAYNGPDQLYPGMTTPTGAASPSNFAINGLQYSQVTWLLDGTDILNHNGNNQTTVYPSVDSIQEIKIIRNGYGAEFGGGGSAQVVITSKTGGSRFHGDAFYFFRNDALNANAYFNQLATPALPRPALRYNNFGYTVGGPVFIPHLYPKSKSRTYFFLSQEFRRIASSPTQTFTNYPALAQANGYFQHQTTGSAPVTASPFPGFNFKVPITDPTTKAYLKDVILPAIAIQGPNSPTDPQGVILFQRSRTSENQELVRLDHQFSDKLTTFVRFIYDPIHLRIPNQYNGANAGFPGTSNEDVSTFGRNLAFHATYIAVPTLVFEGGFSLQPYGIDITPTGTLLKANSPDVNVTLPFVSQLPKIPNLTINGGAWSTRGPAIDENSARQAFLNTNKVFSKHRLIFGANYLSTQRTATQGIPNAGVFAFSGAKNATTGATAFEQSFTNFLTGVPSTFTQASVDAASKTVQNVYELYVQDNWQVNPRLSLNAGVRYSIYGQVYDEQGHLGAFQPESYSPAKAPTIASNGTICTTNTGVCAGKVPNPNYDPLNGITVNNTPNSFGGAISRTPYLNFAPRFGFAYDLTGNGRSAIRGGYGIFFNQTQLNLGMTEVGANPNYIRNAVYSAPPSFANPAAGVANANAVLSVYGQDRNWKQPYTQSYNVDFQKMLPRGFVADVGYVGNATVHLLLPVDINQPMPGVYASATGVTAAPVAGATTAAINAYRPYLGFDSIFQYQTRGFARYNGLQTTLLKRLSAKSLFSANYTFSKSSSNVQTLFVAPQNSYDLRSEWGPSVQDRRHIFTAHFVYQLPAFANRGRLGYAFGNWELSCIVNAASGLWGTVTQTTVDPAGQGALTANSPASLRPDLTGDPNSGGARSLAQFFNTSVFSAVPSGQNRPGNEHRGTVEGPGYQTWSLSLIRNVTMPESLRFQFRVEAFNLFNHVNFDLVNSNSSATAFGQVTSARDNRQLQIAAKLYF